MLAGKVLKKAGTIRDLIDALLLFFTVGEEKLNTTLVTMQSIATEVRDDFTYFSSGTTVLASTRTPGKNYSRSFSGYTRTAISPEAVSAWPSWIA